MERFAYLYVLDTISDWEPGYAIAELHSGRFFKEPGRRVPVRTVSVGTQPVTTMGGVEITPEVLVSDVSPENTAVLFWRGRTPGARRSTTPCCTRPRSCSTPAPMSPRSVGPPAPSPMPEFSTIARTRATARSTSRWSPRNYRGQTHYVDARAVADGNLITADSSGQLLWAKHILERPGVLSDESLEAWYRYFDTGDAQHFFTLMRSLPQ